jgi:hypothetical protein
MIVVRHPRRALLGMMVLLAAVGCRSKPLQKPDAAAGGIGGMGGIDAGEPGDGSVPGDGGVAGAVDAGAPTDAGGASDRPWNVPFAGRRSVIVTSQVFTGEANPAAHVFTMTVDADQRIAITGTHGGGTVEPIEQTPAGPLRFVRRPIFPIQVPADCGGSVTYDDLTFTIDRSGGLTGTGRGQVTSYFNDVGTSAAATMVLTGVPDLEQPKLSLSAAGNIADPWTPIWVVASEPLRPGQAPPVLRSAGGEAMPFTAAAGIESLFVTLLAKPSRMLRFDEPYQVAIDGITDLGGNRASGATSLAFTTGPPPPLITEDGFESVVEATLGGAGVLTGPDAPTISGARSLYIPPTASLTAGKQLALRVPIAPPDRTLRFAFRVVNPGFDTGIHFLVASVGGAIETASLPSEVGAPTTPAVIDGRSVALGPTRTMTIGLPPDVHGDVVLARMASQAQSCGGPPPAAVPGMIIDDLRAE